MPKKSEVDAVVSALVGTGNPVLASQVKKAFVEKEADDSPEGRMAKANKEVLAFLKSAKLSPDAMHVLSGFVKMMKIRVSNDKRGGPDFSKAFGG